MGGMVGMALSCHPSTCHFLKSVTALGVYLSFIIFLTVCTNGEIYMFYRISDRDLLHLACKDRYIITNSLIVLYWPIALLSNCTECELSLLCKTNRRNILQHDAFDDALYNLRWRVLWQLHCNLTSSSFSISHILILLLAFSHPPVTLSYPPPPLFPLTLSSSFIPSHTFLLFYVLPTPSSSFFPQDHPSIYGTVSSGGFYTLPLSML